MQAEIKGTTMPILQVSLEQGEQLVSTHGELAWMTPSIRMSQAMVTGGAPGGPSGGASGGPTGGASGGPSGGPSGGSGSSGGGGLFGGGGPLGGGGPFGAGGQSGTGRGGFMQGLKRMAGGGGLFLTTYEGPGAITFAAKVPGHIVPVDIGPEQTYYVHRHGFLCGTADITPSVGLQQTFRGGMYGGDGFILQKLDGQGRAWIELSGELTSYQLPEGQTLLVHPGHVGMFVGTVQFQVTRMPGIANMFFGDDGFHVVALTGPGQVWLQSMPLQVLAEALAEYIRRDDRDSLQPGRVAGIIGDVLRGS
jgi:uncharacterized protein (AIM24 family)